MRIGVLDDDLIGVSLRQVDRFNDNLTSPFVKLQVETHPLSRQRRLFNLLHPIQLFFHAFGLAYTFDAIHTDSFLRMAIDFSK